jgi:hypothetical protein
LLLRAALPNSSTTRRILSKFRAGYFVLKLPALKTERKRGHHVQVRCQTRTTRLPASLKPWADSHRRRPLFAQDDSISLEAAAEEAEYFSFDSEVLRGESQ